MSHIMYNYHTIELESDGFSPKSTFSEYWENTNAYKFGGSRDIKFYEADTAGKKITYDDVYDFISHVQEDPSKKDSYSDLNSPGNDSVCVFYLGIIDYNLKMKYRRDNGTTYWVDMDDLNARTPKWGKKRVSKRAVYAFVYSYCPREFDAAEMYGDDSDVDIDSNEIYDSGNDTEYDI